MNILQQFKDLKASGKKAFAVLIDPDDVQPAQLKELAERCSHAAVDYIFFGGSLVLTDHMDACIQIFKQHTDIPVVLFPGNPAQVSKYADAILFLSLISGRNAELLIGQQVAAAPLVRASGLEVMPTGYMLIDGGEPTTVSYMSHSVPIPRNKPDIALCTAWAAELMGQQLIYMDAGSGAQFPVSTQMIQKVSNNINLPLIIGGGIRSAEGARAAYDAGAQIVVVGNAIEKDSSIINELSMVAREKNTVL